MNHPNIVKLKEVIRENDILYFVFNIWNETFTNIWKTRKSFFKKLKLEMEDKEKLMEGLAYMHQRGYFFHDLKPGNKFTSTMHGVWFNMLQLLKSLRSCSLEKLHTFLFETKKCLTWFVL
ncbi:hypothetical protein CRYUN_Cryun14cG0164100 [Craigia yunnanensis]